ncbi:preprotein translocase subunit SecY [Lacipirellula parvula]|uniref:Protein translocase subunit SecY n=1 Tax=Lacipirellula parvula TaxID=2650471 RepID=A0A5K7XNG7_9BACT|nr:preprotein translocase subunit SecY [Lacipirellula parvula]BBO36383.1 protein translocase subunit SecY [Lacipirellula parvula]
MWEKLRVVWQIPELRKKILLTLGLLAVYRLGFQIPLPIVDPNKVETFSRAGGMADILKQVAVFSASQLDQVTIFGLGIMPYISASIIFQLLGSVYPPLEALQKEGEAGRKKINEYTRYATVFICIIQSWIYVKSIVPNLAYDSFVVDPTAPTRTLMFSWTIVAVLTMTAGTVFLMWIGEQIDEFGIGNGISLLIMAGILSAMPGAGMQLLKQSSLELTGGDGQLGIEQLIILALMFVAVIFGVVFITMGQRQIPMQSAKHVRGRRVMGGTRQYLPLKVNQAGVMPIIFASSLLMLPAIVFGGLGKLFDANGAWGMTFDGIAQLFGGRGFVYAVTNIALIFFFCFFWTAITFNPKDVADNLKNYGSFIPGYRPGKRTADYLEKVMFRITYVGAGFLALVAIVPSMISGSLNVTPLVANFYGGTSLLIAVSVAFDLVQKIDSHLVMRNYKGLLES